jgi:hypothetical protein
MSAYIRSLLDDPEGLAASIDVSRAPAMGGIGSPSPEAFPDSFEEEEDDDLSFLEGVGDVGMGVVRGGEGFLKSLIGVVDMAIGGGDGEFLGIDLESNWSGRSQTLPGGFVEGATQFLAGFIPVAGWLSKGQKFASLGKFAGVARTTAAAGVADLAAFDGQYQRLSNLMVQYPALKNPVTEFLAADEEDAEALGRLKNAIEGLGIGATVGMAGALIKGIGFLRFASKRKAEGLTPDEIRDAWNKKKEAKELKKDLKDQGVPVDGKLDPTTPATTSEALERVTAPVTRDNSADAVTPGVGVEAATVKPGGEAAIDTTSRQIDRLEGVHSRADVSDWVKQSTDELKASEKFLGSFKEFREDTIARAEAMGEDASLLKNMSEAQLRGVWEGQENLFRELAMRQDRAWVGVTASAEQLTKAADTFTSKATPLNEQAFKDTLERHQNFIAEYTSYGRGASFLMLGRQDRFKGSVSELVDRMRGTEVNDAIDSAPVSKGSRTAEGADLSRDIDELSRVSDPKVSKAVEDRKAKRISEIDERLKEGLDDETAAALKKEKAQKEKALRDQKKLTETLEELEKVRGMSPEEQAKYFTKKQASQKKAATKELTEAQKRTRQVKKELNELKRLANKPAKELKAAKAKLEKKREDLEKLREQLFVSKRLIEEAPPKVKAEKTGELKRIDDEIKALEGAEKFYGRMIKDEKLGEDAVKIINENATLSAQRLKEIERELKLKRDKFPKDTKGAGAALRKKAVDQRKALVSEAQVRLKALDLETEQEFGKFINTMFGSGDTRTLARRYSFLSNIDDPIQRSFAVHNYSKAHLPGKLLDGSLQAFMGSLLSAPATLLINGLGPAIAMGMKNLEVAVGSIPGAVFRGDAEATARLRAVFNVVGFFEDVATSFRNGWAAVKQDESSFLGDARAWDENLKGRGAFAPEVWNKQGTPMEQGLSWMNTITRFPMRILGGTDEFYKTLAAHQLVRQEAMVEAVAKHGMVDGREIAEYVSKTVDGHMLRNTLDNSVSMYSEKGLLIQGVKEMRAKGIEPSEGASQTKALMRYIEENRRPASKSRMAEQAVNYAKDATFTKELEGPVGGRVAGLLRDVPVLKFVLPFLRTPWNILGFGLGRNFAGAAIDQSYKALASKSKSYREIMKTGTGREITELNGRLASSVGYTAALYWYVTSNGDKISGYGPENKEEREVLRASGWQPYSIKMGDNWVSYQRADPITTMLGIFADIKDAQTYQEEMEGAEGLFSALALSVAFNITDRSYLRGLNNLLNVSRDAQTYGPKLLKDIAGGFVPNILNKVQDTGFFNDDDEGRRMIRETRSLADAVLRRIPGAGENIPPKRTILGDPVYRDNVLGIFEPFNFAQISRTSKSLVDTEIANLGHGFTKPDKNFRGIPELNLTRIYNEKGRQAYDRWMELTSETKINGRTMRQALKKLFQSAQYKRLPEKIPHEQTGKKTPRVALVNRIISTYRKKAQRDMIKEFPELRKGYKKAREAYFDEVTQANPIPTP